MKISASRFTGASIAVLSLALAAPATGQDTEQTAPTTETVPGDQAAPTQDGNGIVVYGLRRADTLQDTPAAITAFSAETIANAGIEKPADFINLTPNVNLVETQNVGNAFIVSTTLAPSAAFFACATALMRCAVALYMPACMWLGYSPLGCAAEKRFAKSRVASFASQ